MAIAASSVTVAGAASTSAQASAPICATPPCPIELSFYGPFHVAASTVADKTLCDFPTASTCYINLRGWLYLPGGRSISASTPGRPLVVFVHGSTLNNTAPNARDQARYFTGQNYAFFAVERRGHGNSTGANIDRASCPGCTPVQQDQADLANLKKQVFEVRYAIAYLKKLKVGTAALVNPAKVAVIGHSLGAIISLEANTTNVGQKTIVDIAAASEQWNKYDAEDGVIDGHGPLIETLKAVVAAHKTPVMFMEPLNDCSTVPTGTFSGVIADQNEIYKATLFEPVPIAAGQPCSTAHVNFVFTQAQVTKWGPEVKVWLQRMGVG